MPKKPKKDTLITTAGRDPKNNHGIVNPPVYHASTVIFPTVANLEAAQKDRLKGVYYGRYGTPTTFALEEAVAALEGGARSIAMPSGLAAVAGALMAFLKAGDHLLVTDNVYDPTKSRVCDAVLKGFGIETTYFDPMCGAGIADHIRANTKAVFVESPGSQTFEVQDVPAIAKAAHEAGAVVIMDNTWSGGLYFQPFEHGVDVSVHAATKYIVGHSDAMLGMITTTEELYRKIKIAVLSLGYAAGPDDCYLGLRGLRSISPRLARHYETGMKLARWFEDRPEVATVLHPALPSCPGHEIWKRDFTGASGLFGVVLKDFSKAAVTAMLDGMEYFGMGFSWGGFESLMIPTDPAPMRGTVPWPHKGPSLRIHAGLEDADDLIEDLEKGFERLTSA
ncbi:MAG: cystathionine beta-lyase [Rhodospirillales bacterium]